MTTKLVRDLMHIGVTTCHSDTPLVEEVRRMLSENLEAVVVLDDNGHAAGVLNRQDVVTVFAQSGGDLDHLESLTVAEVMQPDIPTVPPEIPVTAAAQLMLDRGIRTLYVMHHAGGMEWPAAVLRFHELLRYVSAQSEADVADLGASAFRKTPFDIFKERYS